MSTKDGPKRKLEFPVPKKWIYIGVTVLVLLILIGWIIGTYNALIRSDENVKKVWADVETQYQRRVDLIPNLVNAVKGYMQFEQSTLTKITELRSQWQSAQNIEDRVAVGNQLEAVLRSIILTYENYPVLKADTTVVGLMDELTGTENRIAIARNSYNEAVRQFNILVKSVPSNIIASWFGFREKTPFQTITSGAEIAPVVNLTVS